MWHCFHVTINKWTNNVVEMGLNKRGQRGLFTFNIRELTAKLCTPPLEGLKSVGSVRMTQPVFRLDLSVRMRNVKPWCQKAMCLACPHWQVRKWHLVPEQHRRMAALQSWTGLTSTGQQQTRFHAVTHRHCSCYTNFETLTNRSH